MSESEHSPIGASSYYRWGKCPGSVRLSAEVPPAPESEYAKEGTFAHAVAYHCLHNNLNPLLVEQYDGEDVPKEMREALAEYVDAVHSVMRPGITLQAFEHRFYLSSIHPKAWGTADATVYDPEQKVLNVFDLKYGAGIPVEVATFKDGKKVFNGQLLYYALGALLSSKHPAEKVRIWIAQPRCGHFQGPVRSDEIDTIDLLDFDAELTAAIKATEDPNAPLVPGDHCRFCPAMQINPETGQSYCEAVEKSRQEVAKIEFAALDEHAKTKQMAKIADALKMADVLEEQIRRLREYAYAEASHGRTPPGYKLVEKRATRKWKNQGDAIEYLQMMGVDDNVIFDPRELRSPAQIEKSLGKKHALDLSSVITKESTGYALVSEDDRRPAVLMDAKSEFAGLLE